MMKVNAARQNLSALRWAMALVAGMLLGGCVSTRADSPTVSAEFYYEDLDRFAAAMQAIDQGADSHSAMQTYVDNGSDALTFFAGRFGLTAADMVNEISRRPRYFRYLTALRPVIAAREEEMRLAIARLAADAPSGSAPAPIYFIVGNQTAGGQPGFVETPEGIRYFIAVAIDAMAMSDQVDMSEFPPGAGGRQRLEDIAQVVVHETAHVFQRQAQTLENYRSIYTAPGRRTNLALAVREGCADFLTWRASGWVLEPRSSYFSAHEATLWEEFAPIIRAEEDPGAGWFGASSAQHPDRPAQIGYPLGMAMCRTYFDAARDKRAALGAIYQAHLPEHFAAIAAPYIERMTR